MGSKFKVGAFRIGDPPKRGEGLRIGTTRYPPRGVPRSRWEKDHYFDVWFPNLSPSAGLVQEALHAKDDRSWAAFVRKFHHEMKQPDPR